MSMHILPCGIRWQFLALLLSLVVAGCDDSIISIISPISPTDDDSIVPPTDATVATKLSIFLKDDPGDVDIVWVQVDDVVLVGQGAPISLLDEPTDLINLTELVDVAVALVEGVAVEPGLYTQVRFVLGGAVLLDGDGNVYGYGDVEAPPGLEITGGLTCPSCSQSGIKVQLPGGVTLAEGDDAGVLIDFDIAQSFGHQAEQSGKWVMHPVILGKVDDPGAIETKDDADDDYPDEFKGIAALVSVEGDAPTRTVRVELTNDHGSVAVDIVEGSTLFDAHGDILGVDELLAALDLVDLVIEIKGEGERQEDGSVLAATIKVETDDDADDDDPDEFKGIAALVSVEREAPTRTVRVELTNDHGSVAVDIVEGSTLFDAHGDILGVDELLAALDPVDLVIEIKGEGEHQEDGSVLAATIKVETDSVS